jgi:hypothetical protein
MTDTFASNRTDVLDTARRAHAAGAHALGELLERTLDLCAETGAILDCNVARACDELDALLRGNSAR